MPAAIRHLSAWGALECRLLVLGWRLALYRGTARLNLLDMPADGSRPPGLPAVRKGPGPRRATVRHR
jgi:hypothetical protein